MQPTDEQLAIVKSRDNCVINAGAGTAKTTTLIFYAKYRPKARILYIAFNKAIKDEAVKKFREFGVNNITVHTAHSLAYKHIKGIKVTSGYSVNKIIEICGIKAAKTEDTYIVAKMILDAFNIYCNSIENYVDPKKLLLIYERQLVNEYSEYAIAGVKILTRKMKAGLIPFTHDYYLKKFQLSSPKLPFTHILFDEGQDASPVMLDIFTKQDYATKVMVGDSSQAIYGFRLATNALESVDFDRYSLTKSFRFNDFIASQANNILSWKREIGKYNENVVKIQGIGGVTTENSICYLSRSNFGVLESMINEIEASKPQSIYIEGGVKGYGFLNYSQSLNDVISLYYGKHGQIKNPLIKCCKSVSDLAAQSERIGDMELKGLAKIVQAHGKGLRGYIKQLKSLISPNRESANLIFSTVHKAKGLEYDTVVLSNDFVNHSEIKIFGEHYKKLEKKDIFAEKRRAELNEEINILYVAATRTKNKIRKYA